MIQQYSDISLHPLTRLGIQINEINMSNGWDCPTVSDWPIDASHINEIRKIGTNLMLITTEVAEAMEAVRVLDKENFQEELADVLIRVLDTAYGLGLDMDEVVAKKLAKNRTRGLRHGGKSV